MTAFPARRFYKIALFNLAVVVLYGMIMRYKILFPLPFLEQRNLLHAHSHFAFAGWITHFLYTGLSLQMTRYLPAVALKKYRSLIYINLLCSFGMLISFTAQGYKAISIGFSTLSIVVAVIFALYYYRDRKKYKPDPGFSAWAMAGLFFNVLSSLGPFSLAYMMSTHHIPQQLYLGSVYYYLHFQYNGWFFFGALALILPRIGVHFNDVKIHFRILCLATIPTFFLSVLWWPLPQWIYILTVIASVAQTGAWLSLFFKIRKAFIQSETENRFSQVRWFWLLAALALTLKFLLQTASVIPSLSQLVFGYRPIIIAYLHLVFLSVYSIFFLGYLFSTGRLSLSPAAKWGAAGLVSGIILNEVLLAIQGIAAIAYIPVPFINELLLFSAVWLLISAAVLAYCPINRLSDDSSIKNLSI